MKTFSLYACLLICLIACSKDDDVNLKNIVSIQEADDVVVAFATEFDAIKFPGTVHVTYSDNSSGDVSVTFSKGSYNNGATGTYPITGEILPASGTTNSSELKATVNVIVSPIKLKTISQDGVLQYEYFYDALNRLDHFNVVVNGTEYVYTYSDNVVTQRIRKLAGTDYLEKYSYKNNGDLDKVEFYNGNTVTKTLLYTYVDGKISQFDNSNKNVDGQKVRKFFYDSQNDISTVSFDIGNSWQYTYFTTKNMATPLLLDLADPQNQTKHPVATFTYVEASSYTSEYTYNAWNYPLTEVRTYPGDGNSQSTFTYTYE